jgi:hypothetical protein
MKGKNIMQKLMVLTGRAAVVAILLVFAACKTGAAAPYEGFLGKWERQGDEAVGDIVEITAKSPETAYGSLIHVSEFSKTFGFKKGDVKWKLVRKINDRTYEIDNLNAEITTDMQSGAVRSSRKLYSRFRLVIISSNELRLTSLDETTGRIGNVQRWIRRK